MMFTFSGKLGEAEVSGAEFEAFRNRRRAGIKLASPGDKVCQEGRKDLTNNCLRCVFRPWTERQFDLSSVPAYGHRFLF
jgi:hypothetical protein